MYIKPTGWWDTLLTALIQIAVVSIVGALLLGLIIGR